MCSGFTTDVIWRKTRACSVTSEPYQSIRDALHFISATEHLRGKPYKRELLLIASTLLVVQAKNI